MSYLLQLREVKYLNQVKNSKIKYAIVINEFLSLVESPKTEQAYLSYLKKYFNVLNVANPDEYFNNDRDYSKDMITLLQELKNTPKTSQRMITSTVMRFLKFNEVHLSNKVEMIIKNRLRRARPLTRKIVPNTEDLRNMLLNANLKLKAIALFASSSGCRIEEITLLEWDDVDLETREVTIRSEIAKFSIARTTYITQEARDVLIQWKKHRDEYLENAVIRTKKSLNKTKKLDDNRIFPITDRGIRKSWNLLLERTGAPYNTKDNNPKLDRPRYLYHFHTLRKYFKTNLMGHMDTGFIEELLGHTGYCNGAYNGNIHDMLKEQYSDNSSYLEVFTNAESVRKEVKTKIQHQDTVISQLRKENKERQLEVEILRQQMMQTIEMVKSGWYKEMKKPDIARVTTPEGAEVDVEWNPAIGDNLSDEELLKQYIKQKRTQEEIQELGLDEWARRKRNEIKRKQQAQ